MPILYSENLTTNLPYLRAPPLTNISGLRERNTETVE